ncbi:NAD-dependent epimerase/dehydratase family protein [Planctomycetota bacterium]
MSQPVDVVTGVMGFSGSHVAKELLSRGRKVLGVDLPAAIDDPERRATLQKTGLDLNHPLLELIPADLLDRQSLAPVFDRELRHVFHTASLYDYSARLSELVRVNVGGIENLLPLVIAAKPRRFIHWSTGGVFGKPYTAAHGHKVNLPFTEESSSPKNAPVQADRPDGTHLVNAYSKSKWKQEQRVWQAHREDGLPVTVVRPAPIYGPGSRYGHCGIILAIWRGQLPAIPLDAKNAITISVHVADVARFACFVAEHEDAVGEDYNLVDNSVISYHEFLHYIALLTGRRMWDVPLLYLPVLRTVALATAHTWTWLERNLGVPRPRMLEVQSAPYIGSSYWISNRKSLSTGFEYGYGDVREGLKDCIAWMRSAGWL